MQLLSDEQSGYGYLRVIQAGHMACIVQSGWLNRCIYGNGNVQQVTKPN